MNLKNLKFLALSFALGAAVLSGCNNDDETTKKVEPTITVDQATTPNNSTLKPSSAITISFTATKGADGKDLKTFTLTRSSLGQAYVTVETKEIDAATYIFSGTYNVMETEGTDKFKITIEDKDGKVATRELVYNVKKDADTTTQKVTPAFWSAVTFNKTNQFFSGMNGMVYNDASGKANDANIDLTYFFSTASGNNFASPAARRNSVFATFQTTWGSVSSTLLTTTMTKTEFNALRDKDQKELKAAVEKAEISSAISDGMNPNANPAGTRINKDNYVAGRVLGFKNSNRWGLIYVNSVADNADGASSVDIITNK